MIIKDPTRIFVNSKNGSTDVSTLQSTVVLCTVGSDRQLVAAVTGKIIRLMGWIIESESRTDMTRVYLKNGAGATRGISLDAAVANLVGPPTRQPITESGYGECDVSVALMCDVATSDAYITTYYIQYTA